MKKIISVSLVLGSILCFAEDAEVIRQRATEIRENALREINLEKDKVALARETARQRQVQAEEMRNRLRELRLKKNE